MEPLFNDKTPLQIPISDKYRKDPIAIVGMSCRYPKSNSLEEFWNHIFTGTDCSSLPPDFRWPREQCIRNGDEFRNTNAGFLSVPVDEFDSKFFGISNKEAVFMDPQQRLLHELVWESLEDAAINPHSLEGVHGGVFIGSWVTDYKDILNHSGHKDFYRLYMGNSIGAAAARMSFMLGMTGPSIATESGCSSAMVAVHMACKSLLSGESNIALACGVNLLLHPFDKDEIPMALAPDGRCKTFASTADGFGRAEGCAVLVLKRLSDAMRDGDRVWALLRGSAMTQEGISRSMGTPTVHCEAMAMTQALKDAHVAPEQVSYVEAHGTGTVVGDPLEVSAIAKAYHTKNRKTPLMIGSVKTNVGHTEAVSGIAGLMKVVLGLCNEIIPPHIHCQGGFNPAIKLEAVPAIIPQVSVEWKRVPGETRYAGVSAFGIAGTDVHVIVEETPSEVLSMALNNRNGLIIPKEVTIDRPQHLVKLSAKTDDALGLMLQKYRDHVKNSPEDETLGNIAFTANTGRASFRHRAVIVAKSKDEFISNIEQASLSKMVTGEASTENLGKICFLFTGQGSQYAGMGKTLYNTSPIFRIHFDNCEKFLRKTYNIHIKDSLWGTQNGEIGRTIYSQTSIFSLEYALLKLWESWGVRPDYVLGHSLGEFCAAVCAGILSVEDALKLVAERSLLIDQLPHGKMLVIKLDKHGVALQMKRFAGGDSTKILDFAAVNSSEQTVVAGDSDTVIEFSNFLHDNSFKCIVLEASHAFHSKHMDPMLNTYRKVAKSVELRTADQGLPGFISGQRGNLVTSSTVDSEYWVEHTRKKVSFLDASRKAIELGCKVFIEIGPQPVLCALTMMNCDTGTLTCLPSLKKKEDEWITILHSLAKLYTKGFEIDWHGFDRFYSRQKVRLPHYPFIRKKFWPDVMAVAGKKIHPILGSAIPNSSSSKIFECSLNLSNLEYLRDHAIGEHVIFPGAGFLEMCLCAGIAAIEGCVDSFTKPTRSVKLKNLYIEAPLCLHENSSVQAQSIVEIDKNSETDLLVKVSHRVASDSSGNKWLSHARATFDPLPDPQEQNVDRYPLENIIDTPSLLSSQVDVNVDEIYDKLSSVGLKFGPIFRSVEKLWKMDEPSVDLVVKVKTPAGESTSLQQYVLHPVIIDAMLQAIMMRILLTEGEQNRMRKKLCVPIKIGKFVWLSSPKDYDDIFVRVTSTFMEDVNKTVMTDSLNYSAILMDTTGNALAVMSGVEVIDTTVKAVESILKQQQSVMPDLWEESWKRKLGPLEHRFDLNRSSDNFNYDEMLSNFKGVTESPSPILQEVYKYLMEYSWLSMLRALYDCGWDPKIGDKFQTEDLFKNLGIQDEHRLYFGFILEVLVEENMLLRLQDDNTKEPLTRATNSTWQVIYIKYSPAELSIHLTSSIFVEQLTKHLKSTQILAKVGQNFGDILRGRQTALSILFPDDKQNSPSVGAFYEEYGKLFGFEELGGVGLMHRINHFKKTMNDDRFIFRVLEIGAGTGALTTLMLEVLEELGMEYEYTYTDISAGFFPAAEKKFEKFLKNMKFKKLNVEEDPLSQGFIPEYFDYACASEVIHATRDISESLSNVRCLLRPGGKFDLIESTTVSRYMTYLVGLLPGYWRFQDLELRPNHCTMGKEKWRGALEKAGYGMDGIFSCLMDQNSLICVHKKQEDNLLNTGLLNEEKRSKTWVVFQAEGEERVTTYLQEKLQRMNRRMILVHPTTGEKSGDHGTTYKIRMDSEDDFRWLLGEASSGERVVEGVLYCWAMDRNLTEQSELLQPFFYLTKNISLLLENKQQKSLPRVIVLTEGIVPIEDNDMSHYHAGTLWGYCKSLRNEVTEFNCRCIDVTDRNVGDDEFRLWEIFSELFNTEKEPQAAYHGRTKYIPKFQPYKPSATEQDLKLPQATDRFRLIHPETKAIADLQFGQLDHFVLDSNEVEVQVKCFGLNFRDVLNVLKPTEQFKERDFNTVGFDFAGEIKRLGSGVTKWKVGDVVFGVNFDGNALPSHTKIREEYIIAIPDHLPLCQASTLPVVFSTAYHCLVDIAKIKPTDTVLIHTGSGGVGLSAIDICRYFGVTNIITTAGSQRKRNYLKALGIQHIFHSRNTSYADEILRVTNGRGVDVVLNSLTSEGFKEASLRACTKGGWFLEMSKISIWSEEEIKKLRPDINYYLINFDISTVAPKDWHLRMNSLRQHFIDKRLPSPLPMIMFDAASIRQALVYLQKARQIGKVVCLMPEFTTEDGQRKLKIQMFNNSSSYMITGGLGGIGFLTCGWMIEKGAKYLILIGRNPPSEKVQQEISKFIAKGVCIEVILMDIGDKIKCKELFEQKITAMKFPILRGIMHCAGTLSDALVTNQNWEKMSAVFNAKVQGTINLHEYTKNQIMEFFVIFSSLSSLFGTPGQSNHAAVCNFEDTFAHYRHSIGLPATTINWGQWGECGVATEQDFPGIRPLTNLQGLAALEHALKMHRTQTCAVNVDSFLLWSKLVPQLSVYLDERVWKISTGSGGLSIKSEQFWLEYDSKPGIEEKVVIVKEYARKILTSVLRLEEGEKLRDDVDLQEMGVDSLMFVEIKNALQALLGDRVTLNTSVLRECNTINLISDALVKQIEGGDVKDLEPLSYHQISELLKKDCVLPDHIQKKDNLPEEVPVDKIATILLTGCTGTLGLYVLRELLKKEQVKRVICLMRPRNEHPIEERFRKTLENRGLQTSIDTTDKVEFVSGNCAAPHLGLDDPTWQDLITRVDAVFNCFAYVNHIEQYRERPPHVEDVRAVNIGGTKHILEFACEARLKYVFHAASLVSVATTDKNDGSISESWPELEDYDGVTTFAYPISKFVEDMLMKQAVCERKLPCKVFRLPYLCGDSKTGQFPVEQNHMMFRYIFILKNGIMPSNPFPLQMLPTDICAEMIVKLSFMENAPDDVYNITHDQPGIDQEFPGVAEKFGFQVDLVEFSEFARRVLEAGEDESTGGYHPILKELYRNEEEILVHYHTAPAFKHWMEGEDRETFFVSKKLLKYDPDFYKGLEKSLDFVERDLTYVKSLGWL